MLDATEEIERWTHQTDQMPYSVDCRIHHDPEADRLVGVVGAEPLDGETEMEWIGICSSYESVLGVAPSMNGLEYYVSFYDSLDDVDQAMRVIDAVAVDLVWLAYPETAAEHAESS